MDAWDRCFRILTAGSDHVQGVLQSRSCREVVSLIRVSAVEEAWLIKDQVEANAEAGERSSSAVYVYPPFGMFLSLNPWFHV